MTPATHAAVGALAAVKSKKLVPAVVASFALHFVLDAFYHFEAFYPLSVLGRWDQDATMLGLFLVLAALGAPFVVFLFRRDARVGWFAVYGLALSLLPFDPSYTRRVVAALALTALWYWRGEAETRRWVVCGLAGYIPDVAKQFSERLFNLHEAAHYDASLDLGDWVSLLLRGRWQIDVNARIFDAAYQIGYALEILLEGAILFGCLYAVTRRRPSVADLASVHDKVDAVDEGSLVR